MTTQGSNVGISSVTLLIPGPKRRTGVGRDAPLAKIYRGPFDNYVGKPGNFFFRMR